MKGHAEVRRAAAAIDEGTGAHDPGAVGDDGHGLARGLAGSDDVLDDDHAIGWAERKAAPQHQLALQALGEDRADAQRARDLVADDEAAKRRGQHDCGRQTDKLCRKRAAKRLSLSRVLQDEGRLQIPPAVQPR